MKRLIKYCLLLPAVFYGCEEIYTPEIDEVENVIVADARIVSGVIGNEIKLFRSLGYNNNSMVYPPVNGASVWLMSNKGSEVKLTETSTGKFAANFILSEQFQYKIRIESDGFKYESDYEPVPPVPAIDSLYYEAGIKVLAPEGNNDVDDFTEVEGMQLFADIKNGNLPYYRFTARRIVQYSYSVQIRPDEPDRIIYGWDSSYPAESFNIAAPANFSASNYILKHPLYFMPKKPGLDSGQVFNGWILILYQYGLSESGYNYYDDLNKQLEANGKMFDPLYVQARNNLSCSNRPEQLILGNFEIARVKQTRYFINFISKESGYLVKPIPYFYNIPVAGEQIDYPPDFWETPSKQYPKK